MDSLPVQYATTSDGVSIAYATLGEGPTVVFASNIMGDVSWYPVREGEAVVGASPRPIFDHLKACGWRVVAHDVRGMGASSREVLDFSVEGRRRDLEAVVAELGLERFALAARDTGCPVAIDFAAHYPAKVRALMLLDPWVSGLRRFVATNSFRATVLVEPMAEEEWRYYTLTLGNVVTQFKDPVKAQALAEFFRRAGSPRVFLAYRDALRQIDVTPQVGKLRDVPTLIIHNRAFVFGSFELAQEVARGISGARFLSLDGQQEEIGALASFLQAHQPVSEDTTPGLRNLLTSREIEVLRLIAAGRTNQQIADQLVISLNTVLRHVTNIFTKTESKNRAEAAAYAIRQGLL